VPRILLLTLFSYGACGKPFLPGTSAKAFRQHASDSTNGRGKDAFESVCASCHGLDGKGGERGPNTGVTDMPTGYASSLTATELNVSSLTKAARSVNPKQNPRVSRVFEDGDEE
jgi:mono/diheme cytochrome c family protein